MSLFVLDTDHLTLLQRGHRSLLARVAATSPNDLATTIITVEEQLRGWLDAVRRHAGSDRQIWAYRGLHEAVTSFGQIMILDFGKAASAEFEALRRQQPRIGSQDMRIAAIILTTGSTLLTRNRRDFSRVPSLVIEDWTVG